MFDFIEILLIHCDIEIKPRTIENLVEKKESVEKLVKNNLKKKPDFKYLRSNIEIA